MVRLTVCESDTPSSNPAQCSFFFFSLLPHLTLANLLACTYICIAKLVTWGVGPDVNFDDNNIIISAIAVTGGSWHLYAESQ